MTVCFCRSIWMVTLDGITHSSSHKAPIKAWERAPARRWCNLTRIIKCFATCSTYILVYQQSSQLVTEKAAFPAWALLGNERQPQRLVSLFKRCNASLWFICEWSYWCFLFAVPLAWHIQLTHFHNCKQECGQFVVCFLSFCFVGARFSLIAWLQKRTRRQDIKLAQGKPCCVLFQWLHTFPIRNKSLSGQNMVPVIWARPFVTRGGFIVWNSMSFYLSSNILLDLYDLF